MCKFVSKTQLILKRFPEPFESTNAPYRGSITACTSLDLSEVEADVPLMRQGETEGQEGTLGYRTRRMRRDIDEMKRQVRTTDCVLLLFPKN